MKQRKTARSGMKQPQVERLLYSKGEVAVALGISVRSVHELIRSGELPARRIGARRVLVPVAALREFASRDHVRRQTMQ